MSWLTATPGGVTVEHRPYRVANCGSRWTDPDAAPRVTLHTTESRRGSIDAVLALWSAAEARGTLTVPHFTIDAGTRRVVQHRDMLGPACALEGCSNGEVATNGVPNVQVEIVGYAHDSPGWPDDDLAFIADWLVAVRRGGFPVPLQCSVPFFGDRNAPYVLASYSSPLRLHGVAWRVYAGLLGHQHVPCNAHWDPGALDVARILYHAHHIEGGDMPPSPDGGLSVADAASIEKKVDALSAQVAALQSVVGVWLQDGRAYEGLVPIKVPGDPAQYLVLIVPGRGPVKTHLTAEVKGVLQKQNTIQTAPAGFDGGHPVDYVTLTDPAQVAWFNALPTV